MDWLVWIGDNWKFVVEVVGFVVGVGFAVYKFVQKFDDMTWAAFWQFALSEGRTYLQKLAADAQREITESDVKRAAEWVWQMVNGPEEYMEAFASALWLLWMKLCAADNVAVATGLIPPRRRIEPR